MGKRDYKYSRAITNRNRVEERIFKMMSKQPNPKQIRLTFRINAKKPERR